MKSVKIKEVFNGSIIQPIFEYEDEYTAVESYLRAIQINDIPDYVSDEDIKRKYNATIVNTARQHINYSELGTNKIISK